MKKEACLLTWPPISAKAVKISFGDFRWQPLAVVFIWDPLCRCTRRTSDHHQSVGLHAPTSFILDLVTTWYDGWESRATIWLLTPSPYSNSSKRKNKDPVYVRVTFSWCLYSWNGIWRSVVKDFWKQSVVLKTWKNFRSSSNFLWCPRSALNWIITWESMIKI